MNADLALTLGLVLGLLAIPAVVSAISDGRTPRIAALVGIGGLGLVAWAVATKPGGYRLEDVPMVFVSVVGRFFH